VLDLKLHQEKSLKMTSLGDECFGNICTKGHKTVTTAITLIHVLKCEVYKTNPRTLIGRTKKHAPRDFNNFRRAPEC